MGCPVLDDLRTPAAGDVVHAFLRGELPREAWTHEAHLRVCLALLDGGADPDLTVDRLRFLIRSHNQRVGTRPGQAGYHETLTRYFVEAVAWVVAGAAGTNVEDVLAAPACQVGAPRRHWSPPHLDSLQARTTWVEPDLAPLPWRADPSRSPARPAPTTTARPESTPS